MHELARYLVKGIIDALYCQQVNEVLGLNYAESVTLEKALNFIFCSTSCLTYAGYNLKTYSAHL